MLVLLAGYLYLNMLEHKFGIDILSDGGFGELSFITNGAKQLVLSVDLGELDAQVRQFVANMSELSGALFEYAVDKVNTLRQ